jgi:urease accessory protein
VINKFDLAPYVGVNLERMASEARQVRNDRPVTLTNCATGEGVDAVVDAIVESVLFDAH